MYFVLRDVIALYLSRFAVLIYQNVKSRREALQVALARWRYRIFTDHDRVLAISSAISLAGPSVGACGSTTIRIVRNMNRRMSKMP